MNAESILPEIRRRLAKIDPDQPVYNVRNLEDIFRENHAFFRFNTLLLTVFAAIALILSVIGIYGVISYAVSQRIREFGIRLALGSPANKILFLALRQGIWMSAVGISLGLVLSWPAIRFLSRTLKESMYLDLTGTGPLLFSGLAMGMALTMLLASFIPARHATKADPLEALRCE